MTAHPYRTPADPPPRDRVREALRWADRVDLIRWRNAQWFRRRVGGSWVLLCAIHIPGAPEWWQPEAEPHTSPSAYVIEREVWP